MRVLDVWRLKIFFEVAREGSTSRAAEKLNMTQSAVSRAIITLEERLRTQLFDRVRGMRLTAQGERLYEFAERILHETDNFEKLFTGEEKIQGNLKITALPYIATDWLIPNLKDFLKLYPQVNLQIFPMGEEVHDISDYDVAIRSFIPHQPDLIQEHLLTLKVCFFAHPDYLQEFGTPLKPKDLNKHRIIEAPDLTAIIESGLQEVLPNIQKPQAPIYFIFHKERRKSKLINELLKYLLTKKK